jgi:hypothetical protein
MHKGEDTDYYLKKWFRVIEFETNQTLVVACKTMVSGQIINCKLIIVEGAITHRESGEIKATFYMNNDVSERGTIALTWHIGMNC